MRRALIPLILLLSACATTPQPEGERHLPAAAIGQTVMVDGPQLTVVELLEDSRCPADVQCVQAGRVRVRVAVHLGAGDRTLDLTLGEPVQVADGALELVSVQPDRTVAAEAIAPAAYRFSFRFDGGY
ncbi:hypothetical protein [Croceibacterium mercuriale]|uniref:hypothetical protein n=1 Tax=Croceibacterium mercuriale TaxID=1572751 RepID=UPI000A833AF8|nr:hypothetical protein [Croceibacterium mercuriale]